MVNKQFLQYARNFVRKECGLRPSDGAAYEEKIIATYNQLDQFKKSLSSIKKGYIKPHWRNIGGKMVQVGGYNRKDSRRKRGTTPGGSGGGRKKTPGGKKMSYSRIYTQKIPINDKKHLSMFWDDDGKWAAIDEAGNMYNNEKPFFDAMDIDTYDVDSKMKKIADSHGEKIISRADLPESLKGTDIGTGKGIIARTPTYSAGEEVEWQPMEPDELVSKTFYDGKYIQDTFENVGGTLAATTDSLYDQLIDELESTNTNPVPKHYPDAQRYFADARKKLREHVAEVLYSAPKDWTP